MRKVHFYLIYVIFRFIAGEKTRVYGEMTKEERIRKVAKCYAKSFGIPELGQVNDPWSWTNDEFYFHQVLKRIVVPVQRHKLSKCQ